MSSSSAIAGAAHSLDLQQGVVVQPGHIAAQGTAKARGQALGTAVEVSLGSLGRVSMAPEPGHFARYATSRGLCLPW